MSILGRILRSLLISVVLAAPSAYAIPLIFGEASPTAPLVTNLDPLYWSQSIVAPDQWLFTKTSAFTSTAAPIGVVPDYTLAWLEPGSVDEFNFVVIGADNSFILIFSDIPVALLPLLPVFVPPAAFDSQALALVTPLFDPGLAASGSFFDTVTFVDLAAQAEAIPEPQSLALMALALACAFGVIGRSRRRLTSLSA